MFQPTAKVIADSLNTTTGDRLTTMVLKYHRFIHSEFLTHRVFSRNSSSGRAIPVNKLIQNVIDNDVYPLRWGKNQKGMQAREELSEDDAKNANLLWWAARKNAVESAQQLANLGVHKQVVNRVLEPFSTITVIVSATDWDNFFEQRCHPDAQPEMQVLANKVLIAYQKSSPEEIRPREWHIPFCDKEDGILNLKDYLKLSAGRCARVSYLNHEGVRSLEDDFNLHDKLIFSEPKHLSPFEHQAVALPNSVYSANFKGFKQYRKFIESGVKP